MAASHRVRVQIRSKEELDGEWQESLAVHEGRLIERENGFFLHYMQIADGFSKPISTSVRVKLDRVEISRSGEIQGCLIYQPQEWTKTSYSTDMGALEMQIFTERFQYWKIDQECYRLIIFYHVIANEVDLGRRALEIEARSLPEEEIPEREGEHSPPS